MSLVSVDDVRVLWKTPIADAEIQQLIDRVENFITEKLGGIQDSGLTLSLTETLYVPGQNIYLKQPISSVTSITVDGDSAFTIDDDYRVYLEQGRIVRLPLGASWGAKNVVVYKPQFRQIFYDVIISTVRIMGERTAMDSESMSGAFSYKSPKWDEEISKQIRRLTFVGF